MVKYSREPDVPAKCAKAKGSDIRVHFKNTHEVAAAVQGMNLEKAQTYLRAVIERRRCIPYRHFKSNIGRTAQAKEFKTDLGRWPEKSCRIVLDLLKNAQSNAENKNLDVKKLFIWSIVVQQAQRGRRRVYRAHGRINPFMSSPCHINIVLKEKEEAVPLPPALPGDEPRKRVRLSRRNLLSKGLHAGGGLAHFVH